MAYAALVSLSQTILQYDDGYKSLHDHVLFLQSFLEEKSADNLEVRIRDTAYEAEDIIDYIKLSQIQSFNSPHRIAGLGKFKCFSFISEQIRSCYYHPYAIKELRKKLQIVRHEFDSIVGEVMAIKNSLKSRDVKLSDSPTASSLSRQVHARTDKVSMVGFDENLNKIKSRLCGQSSKLQVIPIFGMGGIGKTTLAINAYQDPLTVKRFDIRAWVTVSQDYSIKRILSELLVSMGALSKNESVQSSETMDVRVFKSLKDRRYLVVIDDMWSTNVWDDLRRLLPDDNNGSRIMLTTRLSDVAGYAHGSSSSSSHLHKMQLMDEDQSWHLLSQHVFRQEQCPNELEDIGRIIAKHCKGLPLAIVVIAGVLRSVSQTLASWENVAKNVNSAVATNEEQFANILSLSYTHLPHHLRSCFLYMGGFPEDYEIHVSKLIKLWTAEGFIKSSGSKSYEESGEEYLEDLVKRSLIMVSKRKSNGKIKSCNVHDLVRELCIRKSQEEKFLLNLLARNDRRLDDQRRVSINRFRDSRYHLYYLAQEEKFFDDSTIRTILWFPYGWYCDEFDWLKDFRLLRILDVQHANPQYPEFPTVILDLIFLRYLAFSFAFAHEIEIPASISRLGNLETLIIRPHMNQYLGYRVQFPLEIWGMTQLRHLVLLTLTHLVLPDPCPSEYVLENLQTLAQVKDFKCTEGILQMVPNLKKLGIVYSGREIENSESGPEYHLENLVHLHRLEKLKICVVDWYKINFGGNLAFPKMLKKLTLKGFLFSFQNMEMIGLLPNLQVLKLEGCNFEESKWETNEGQFPQLKSLQITTTYLRQWSIAESSHFPRLKRLMLLDCPSLFEIPDVIGEIPTLELIEVDEWDKDLVESAKRMQEEQQSYGNDTLQVNIRKY